MAAVTTGRNNSGIFWINDTSDEDQPVIFYPGVSRERSLRTAFKSGCQSGSNNCKRNPTMRAKCGIESRNESSMGKASKKQAQPLSLSSRETTNGKDMFQSTSSSVLPSPTPVTHNLLTSPKVSQAKSKTSLKDLCPEDKQRIANLIQELARVSEEKEESVQKLRDEQGLFERKIQHLEQQNTLIIQERESLQQQYRECQELLGLYQQYLSQQQDKLNQSIAQLSHSRSHRKVPAGEASCGRPTARSASRSVLDGSYLGMPGYGARQPSHTGSGAGRGGASSYHSSAPLSTLSPSTTPPDSSSSSEHPAAERPIMLRGGSTRRNPRPASPRRHTTVGCNTEAGPANGAAPLDAVSAPESPFSRRDPPMDAAAEGTLTAAHLGGEDWEEKRHLLLLQKMQLEVEREKLQARLAQQEERLLRQNQQLRQSRLDYSRFQQASATELGHAISRNAFLEHNPPQNGHVATSEERGPGDAEDMVEAEHLAGEVMSHQSSLKAPTGPTSPPMVHPRTPHARLDSSLIELLEVFSPISVPELGRPPVQQSMPLLHQPPPSAPRPARRTLLSPSQGCYPRTPQHDLEESQILEEIFFIC
ncbi:protein hinderin isoform X2 [Hypomesus transpacificus]|uniref:protein hinderin isoform X2 n=1 Tax=Hypomesus transpacificus TaxID=137520 RepID=UPI001F076A74|nr:protein hinderin isoform X2 [Hypomesus transpacificus]